MSDGFRAFVEIKNGVPVMWGVVWPHDGGFTARVLQSDEDPSKGFIETRGLVAALPHERLVWLDELAAIELRIGKREGCFARAAAHEGPRLAPNQARAAAAPGPEQVQSMRWLRKDAGRLRLMPLHVQGVRR